MRAYSTDDVGSDRLPKLIGEVAAQLAVTNKLLEGLPPAVSSEPSAFVLDLVTKFRNDVVELVEGSPRHTRLVQANRDTYEKFKYAILGSAPPFLPYENAQVAPKTKTKARHMKIDDEDAGRVLRVARYLYLEDVREHIRAYVLVRSVNLFSR